MRSRLVGLAVWVSVVATLLFGVPLGAAVFQFAVQAERDNLGRIADAVAIAVAADVVDDQDIDHPEYIDGRGAAEVAVYDEDGIWLGGARAGASGTELASALRGDTGIASDEDRFVVAVPVTHVDDVIGAVRATAPRSAILPTVVPVWVAMAGLAVLAVAGAWLVGRRQAGRLAVPLEGLAGAAHQLGEGDFSVRVKNGGIPEIDAVGAAINSTAVRLDDLLARERAFSADASHQLRTPLTGLRLRLEAALEQPQQDLQRAIVAGLADADRLEKTIDELLTLAREKRTAPAGPIDLTNLLAELSADWRGRLALLGRDLHLTIQPGTPNPRASAAAVRQVLAVLLDNATTHGAGTVSVMVREAPGAVAIDVADQGRGVQAPATALFARRTDRRNKHGIGLALARRLAEGEQGRLELARPAPPVFSLLLPSSLDGPEYVQPMGAFAAGG